MNINKEGLELVKSSEGLRLDAYQDVVGIWTIGFGATGPGISKGLHWTAQQAEDRLRSDLAKFEQGVSACLKKPATSNQFSALVSLAYNVGLGNLQSSTLIKKLNAGDAAGAADEFLRWNKAGGKEIAGLTKRRQAERTLFMKSEVQSKQLLPDGPSEADMNKALADLEKKIVH